MKKGVLGVRQDSKKQILFSFQAREGEEWPSDSSDEDFDPYSEDSTKDDQEKPLKKSSKQSLASKKVFRKLPNKSCTNRRKAVCRNEVTDGWWDQRLPLELLHHIFNYVVVSNGAVPFLCRASRICKLWREASRHASLWRNVDLSYGYIKKFDQTLVWLCENRFSQIQQLDLTGWARANMSEACCQAVVSCKTLQSLFLSGCKKLSSHTLRRIVEGLPHLQRIDLSSTNADVMSTNCLKIVIQNMGERLTHLDISRNLIMSLSQSVLTSLMTHCKNLRVVDISGSLKASLVLDIERFQQHCPLLHTLSLTCTAFSPTTVDKTQLESSPGFEHLEELYIGINPTVHSSCVTDDVLYRLTRTSSSLTVLEARCCRKFSAVGLASIPSTKLEKLYLSRCTPGNLRVDDLASVLSMWRDSLVELDIAWNASSETDILLVVDELVKSHDSHVTTLDLCGTAVNEDCVRKLLCHCKRLSSIDLSSCRGLPRGMKSMYSGRTLEQLKKDLLS